MYFGDNGVPLLEIDDEKVLENELKPKSQETVLIALLTILATSGVCLYSVFSSTPALNTEIVLPVCFAMMVFSLIPVFVYFSSKAIEQGHLSQTFKGRSKHRHVPGAVVLAIAIILAFIVFMARYFHLQHNLNGSEAIVLENKAGLWVLSLIALSFVLMILLPRLSSSKNIGRIGNFFASLLNEQTGLGKYLAILGNIISRFDSWLVYIIAPAAGVTQKKTRTRYLIIIGYLLPCGILAWYLPTPYGIFPILAAFTISISVARRWAWVESDREITLRNPKYSAEQLRVGVDQDLRDEALLALLSLIIMLPLAMRQAHMLALDLNISEWGLFAYHETDSAASRKNIAVSQSVGFIEWLAFFGTELAKAVPFVDWADIYQVESRPTIQSAGPYSFHVVFAARAIVDLVFLGALLQAITSSFKLSQHKKLFFEREINVLDPILEKLEFDKLARFSNGKWVFNEEELLRFKHYDHFVLALRRVTSDPKSKLYAVASRLLALNNVSPTEPEEVFIELVSREDHFDYDQITSAYEDARQIRKVDFDFIKYALGRLNGLANYTKFRRLLVKHLSNSTYYPRKSALISLFRDIGFGPNADTRFEVRMVTIPVLLWAAKEQIYGHWPKQTLENMALKDPSVAVRREAHSALDELRIPQFA